MKAEVAAAYSATGATWADGPARVYRRMAEVLVDACPGGVAGRMVLDLGAGSGVAGEAALAAGASRVVAVDVAVGMLLPGRSTRPPAAVADALALPLADGSVDAVVAAFCLNHLPDPSDGLHEAGRALRPGGGLVAGAYAVDDTHPVKEAVEAAASASGWTPPAWYRWMRTEAVPGLASVDSAMAALSGAGLRGGADHVRVPIDGLCPEDLVRWRLGLAQLAPFVAGLDATARDALVADAVARLGPEPPPLVRSIIVLTART